jgi:hypothetical protein
MTIANPFREGRRAIIRTLLRSAADSPNSNPVAPKSRRTHIHARARAELADGLSAYKVSAVKCRIVDDQAAREMGPERAGNLFKWATCPRASIDRPIVGAVCSPFVPESAMPVSPAVADFAPEAQRWRPHLHARPELLYEVDQTAAFVVARLTEFGCDEVRTGLGRAGSRGEMQYGREAVRRGAIGDGLALG